MKNILTACLAVIFLAGTATATATAGAREKISEPLKYKGYSEKEYDDYKLLSQYVEMSDGVKLAVDIYLPRKGPKRDTFPAVVEYTPYSRSFANPSFAPMDGKESRNMMGGRGALVPMPFCFDMGLIEHGYALVIADIRGSGASFGSRFDLSQQIGRDGAELVEWIAAQPWSDGNVGMKGGSYMAISQILTAAERPPHLKAIFLMVYPFGYQDLYVGGIYNLGFMASFSEMLRAMNMNMNRTVGGFPISPSAPVLDEDGDGKFLDEIPLDKNGDGSFLDDYNYPENPDDPPLYSDGAPRGHVYFLATKDHAKNPNINDWVSQAHFIDTNSADLEVEGLGDYDGYAISPAGRIPEIMASGIPIYHVGCWFDAQVRSTMMFFSTAEKTNPSKLFVIPGYHILSSPFYKYLGENQTRILTGVKTETLRFFDRYLKGIDNGIEREEPITLYVMGEGPRRENEWPLNRAEATDFYFSNGGLLARGAAADATGGADRYTADLSHDSGFGPAKGNRWKMYFIPPEVPDRSEMDLKCMTYTTQPLADDTEVTGHPIVDIWVSSTAPDGDFFVFLEDITEDGRAILVTEQPQRAGFALLKDNNLIIRRGETGVDMLPDLPWHGYEKADYNPDVFKNGNVVNLKFDLQPTSWVFRKGHRIRVSIAAADWPTFPLHPSLSPANDPAAAGNTVPKITFHRDAKYPSKITLPVVGR